MDEGDITMAERCVDIELEIGQGLGYPFKIALFGGEVEEVERKELEFVGDAIKVFVFVFVDVG